MLESKEGKQVPDVTFRARRNDQWVDISTDELFKGKNVIVFSLPGAFTPTCSSSHLPRYNQLTPKFKELGVDDVVCISVNDAFVMNVWQRDQAAGNITFIPDGNGEFSSELGMLVDKRELGFGNRSWRYSMYVEDGVIKKMFIEPEKPGDPYEVSDADTMLNYLAPETKAPASVSIFTKPGCSFCAKAKDLLNKKGYNFEEIVLGQDASMVSVQSITGQNKVPQIFIDGQHIQGAQALEEHLGT